MIRIVRKKGIAVPELCCDVCLGPVAVLDLAMLVWFGELEDEGEATNLFLVHKGFCDRMLRDGHSVSIDGDYGRFHELERGLELLLEGTLRHA